MVQAMVTGGSIKFAYYSTFSVDSKDNDYQLKIGGYEPLSDMGDDLANSNGMKFSTFDRDNDLSGSNCAATYKMPWWNNNCGDANPLG